MLFTKFWQEFDSVKSYQKRLGKSCKETFQ